jgi:dTMP kinase
MKKQLFISIEGIEGMGKSTVFKGLAQYLSDKSIDFISTREPGGTPLAERIRKALLAHEKEAISPVTELLLMFASRAQHVDQVVMPAIEQGKWVICDRFVDASYAYQGGGRKIDQTWLDALTSWTVPMMPDITFLLDGPESLGASRISKRSTKDRIEIEKKEFFTRARQAYLSRAQQDPKRFVVIDATLSKRQVMDQAIQHIEPYL